jgi:uncharacterized protein (DUF433 family)
MDNAAFGLGIYTAPEAAWLVGMGAKTLRRWLLGYEYDHHGRGAAQPPLWRAQHPADDGEVLLGFRDLVEARIVNALRRRGIGLPTIRLCLERARQIVGDDHPLSTRQFKTDGRNIFLEITHSVAEPELVDLKRRQGVFRRVVEPSLAGLEFGPDAAERWWLLPNKKTVVADPLFAFGQPSLAGHGLTTARLVQAVKAEGGAIRRVANMFELREGLVRDAVAFEQLRGSRLVH